MHLAKGSNACPRSYPPGFVIIYPVFPGPIPLPRVCINLPGLQTPLQLQLHRIWTLLVPSLRDSRGFRCSRAHGLSQQARCSFFGPCNKLPQQGRDRNRICGGQWWWCHFWPARLTVCGHKGLSWVQGHIQSQHVISYHVLVGALSAYCRNTLPMRRLRGRRSLDPLKKREKMH